MWNSWVTRGELKCGKQVPPGHVTPTSSCNLTAIWSCMDRLPIVLILHTLYCGPAILWEMAPTVISYCRTIAIWSCTQALGERYGLPTLSVSALTVSQPAWCHSPFGGDVLTQYCLGCVANFPLMFPMSFRTRRCASFLFSILLHRVSSCITESQSDSASSMIQHPLCNSILFVVSMVWVGAVLSLDLVSVTFIFSALALFFSLSLCHVISRLVCFEETFQEMCYIFYPTGWRN